MTRWEYCLIIEKSEILTNAQGQRKVVTETNAIVMGKGHAGEFKSITEAYYKLGINGWELVTIIKDDYGATCWEHHYFKRPLVKKQQS